MIKTILKFNKRINMVFVSIILIFFYFTAFGLSKVMYVIIHRLNKNKDSYWQNHIESKQKIDYASPY